MCVGLALSLLVAAAGSLSRRRSGKTGAPDPAVPPGCPSTLGRALGQKADRANGPPVINDNRPCRRHLGLEDAKAPPDGHRWCRSADLLTLRSTASSLTTEGLAPVVLVPDSEVFWSIVGAGEKLRISADRLRAAGQLNYGRGVSGRHASRALAFMSMKDQMCTCLQRLGRACSV